MTLNRFNFRQYFLLISASQFNVNTFSHFSVPVQGARHVLQLRRDGALHPGAGRGRAAAQGAGGEPGLRAHPGGGRRGAAQDRAHLHPTVRAPRPIYFSKSAKTSVFNVLSRQLLPKFIH